MVDQTEGGQQADLRLVIVRDGACMVESGLINSILCLENVKEQPGP